MKTLITAGKGGTGKSSVLAYLYRLHFLEELPGRLLIVDADPQQSLSVLLGVEDVCSLGDLRRQRRVELQRGTGIENLSRREFARQFVQESLRPLTERVDYLAMGRNDEPGCQCIVNTLLSRALETVAADYEWVLVDNEAGLEPMGRHGWAVDVLLLFANPHPVDMRAAYQIIRQAQDTRREIRCAGMVLNRTRGQPDPEGMPVPLLGTLPYSEALERGHFPDAGWVEALGTIWHRLLGEILLAVER